MVIDLLLAAPKAATGDVEIKVAIIGLLGLIATGLLTFLTTRYTARKSTAASQEQAHITERQVNVNEWQALLSEFKSQVTALSQRVTDLETRDTEKQQRIEELQNRVRIAELARDDSDAKYRVAIRHLKDILVWAVDPHRSDTPPVTPEQLISDLK